MVSPTTTVQAQQYFKAGDAIKGISDPLRAIQALALVFDRQQELQARVTLQQTLSLKNQGIFIDTQNQIQGLFPQVSRSTAVLQTGMLVYNNQPQQILPADAPSGQPATGVVLVRQVGGNYLWAPLGLLRVFVQGAESDVPIPGSQQLYLGALGNAAFAPPTTSGSVAQIVGWRWFFDAKRRRYFSFIQPSLVNVQL